MYYWNFIKNAGDLLGPWLYHKITGKKISHKGYVECKYITVGSLLNMIPIDFNGHIWGTGFLYKEHKRFHFANIHAVRGKITRNCIFRADCELGDPGIITSMFYRPKIKKKNDIGYVIHHSMVYDEKIKKFCKEKDIKIINPCCEVEDFIQKILSCKKIISSSLHGLVIAHSYGIDCAVFYPDVSVVKSDVNQFTLKIADFYSAFDISVPYYTISTYPGNIIYTSIKRKKIDKRCEALMNVCPF